MSDRLKGSLVSKWTGALLLGVGTVALAGGIGLVVYYVVKKRQASRNESSSIPDPQPTPVIHYIEPVQEVPVVEHVSEPVQEPPVGEMVHEPPQEPPVGEMVHEPLLDVVTEDKELAVAPGLGGPDFLVSASQSTDEPDGAYETKTYEDVLNEIKGTLQPVFDNSELYLALYDYLKVENRSMDRVIRLVGYMESYQTALANDEPRPEAIVSDIEPMMDKMSSDPAVIEVEVNSLKMLVDALYEFPIHIVRKAMTLSQAKRQVLIDTILSTPHGVSKHVYMDKGPFNDQELHPIMTRMNYSIPPYQTKLTYTGPLSGETDRLTLGLYLMLGTVPPK